MIHQQGAAVLSIELPGRPTPEIIAHSPDIMAALVIKNARLHLLVKSA
jgi:hypothetical protein